MPSRDMDIFEDITTQLVLRARLHDDEASITLKGHLLTEYLMDRILKVKATDKNYGSSTYSKKLKALEQRQLLPEEILNNLQLLNSIRNKMAHELDVSICKEDMIYYKTGGNKMSVKPKKGNYPQRYYLKLLCHGILAQMTNHMLINIKVDPRWKHGMA
jgi:hypothetical protein